MEDAGSLPRPDDRAAEEAVGVIRRRTALEPSLAVVLGSGLGSSVADLREEAAFSFEELPGFPPPTVPGHAGRLAIGRLDDVPVAVFQGRVHYYEGHPIEVSALPVRVARLLGAGTMVLTASVGALDPSLSPGTLVVGSDHMNMMGVSPLRGWRMPDGSPPFVDVSTIYDRDLADRAVECAAGLGIRAVRGVYVAMAGPAYETPAEVEFLRRAGGTVVGMSVVPEAVPAHALGMRVLGLYSVTNAAGEHVGHGDVVAVSKQMSEAVSRLLRELLPHLSPKGA